MEVPARWKKKEKTLEILLPQTRQAVELESCELRTEMAEGWSSIGERLLGGGSG